MDALALVPGGMRGRNGVLQVGLLAAILSFAPAARADGEATRSTVKPSAAELASARQLFRQALAAEDRRRWAEALEMYQRVSQVAVSPSVHYHMGVCNEELGHLVEAINAFELAASGADARGDEALLEESRARLEQLRARTPQLTITVPEEAAGLRIEIDGQPISAALVGTSMLVNPGERRISIRADSHEQAYEAAVSVNPGDALSVKADLGPKKAPSASSVPSVPAASSVPPVPPGPSPRAPVAAATRPRPAPPREEPSRLPGFVAGGAAIALAAGAVVTGVTAYRIRDDYLTQNADPAPGTREAREDLKRRGEAFAIASTAFTGGALIAAGLSTYLLWPSSAVAGKPSARVTPWVDPAGAGLVMVGAL